MLAKHFELLKQNPCVESVQTTYLQQVVYGEPVEVFLTEVEMLNRAEELSKKGISTAVYS